MSLSDFAPFAGTGASIKLRIVKMFVPHNKCASADLLAVAFCSSAGRARDKLFIGSRDR